MKKKQNSLKLLSLTLVFVVFSAISALSFFPALDLFKKLSDDSPLHQTLPVDSNSSEESQTIEEESLDHEANEFINDFTSINLRCDCKCNHCIESPLPILIGSRDIRILPPKNT